MAFVICGAVSAANVGGIPTNKISLSHTSHVQTNVNSNVKNSVKSKSNVKSNKNASNNKALVSSKPVYNIISGFVTKCHSKDAFHGVKITVKSPTDVTMAKALTNSQGYYKVSFISGFKTFKVTASYPGHIISTKKVVTKHSPINRNGVTRYGIVNFQLGTLGLTKGSWDNIGLDSNDVTVGPDHFLVQIHVTNNAATTANNVVGTFAFTSVNANIILDPLESPVKNLGNIAPGQTKDLFYLVNVIRTSAAYNTARSYTVSVAGSNTGSPIDTISGNLVVQKLLSQNRNHVNSIVITPSNPTLGSNFGVTVSSSTSSSTLDNVELPVVLYDPSKIQPVSVTITYDSTSSNSILLASPGANIFTSTWTFAAIGAGTTPLSALILDQSGNSYHYNIDQNSTAVTLNITPSADLAITKGVDNTSPDVGDNVLFTLTAQNLGPDNATGVTVNDLLPAGLSFVSATPSVGTYNQFTGVWTIGNLNVGSTATLNILATVTQSGQIVNTATIQGNEPDPNPNNNIDSVSLNGQSAELVISKAVNNPTPFVGDDVTFTVTLSNNGPNDAANVFVNDLLPSGLSLVSATPSTGSYNPITGVWTIGTLIHGATVTLTLVAQVTQTGILTNTAQAFTSTFDPTTPDIATASVDAQPSADLAVIKTVNNPTPNVGQNVIFTITASNLGPNDATGVFVNDLLPAGLTFVSATPSVGTYDPLTGIWTIGNLANGASAVLSIVATVTQTGQINNIADIAGNEHDPNPLNNQDIAVINGQPTADLAISKTVNNPTPNVGDNVVFTITIFNAGPDDAVNTIVNDLLPAGLSLVSATPSVGSYNQVTGVWTVGTLIHQTSQVLVLVAHVLQTGVITNTAVVSSDTFDPHPEDNTDSATINAQPSADLAVVKTVNNTTPNVGNNVIFTITASNLGPNDATGVIVTDNLPPGLSFVSATPSTGTYSNGVWTIGNLAHGASAVLTIVATVLQTGTITNVATISGNEHDPNPLNNQDLAVINGQPTADLAISKTVNNPTPNVGDNVIFTLTVFNAGPNDAVNTVVHDLLPAGLTFVSATPSVGSYNPVTGIWTIGTLVHQGTATLTLIAHVVTPGLKTNTATVSSSTFDPHPEDNTDSVTINAQPSADLAIVKTVNNLTPNVGQNIIYTLTASNLGPNDATGVFVNDLLPAGLTFVSATPSVGTYNPLTGIWTIGNLANGASAVLSIVATVEQTGQINNIATIAGNEHDPNPLNNQDIAVINGQPTADLGILKTVDNANPFVGDNVLFTIEVFNAGPDAAANVVVNDLLPAGLQFISASTTVGSYNPVTGVWTIGTLPHSATVFMTILAKVLHSGAITNTAVVSSTTFDPHPDDNTSSVTVDAAPSADLAVVKTVNHSTPHVGTNVRYTITAINNGPSDATGVIVNDLLPAGMSFVSATPSVGSYNHVSGVWTIGNFAHGSTATLVIVAKVLQVGVIDNTAVISGNEHDPNTANNNYTAELDALPTSDLTISKTVNHHTQYVGQNVNFNVSVFNAGPNDATGVVVHDKLPSGLHFLSATPSVGIYNSVNGVWTIGNLVNHGTATLNILAQVTHRGLLTNIGRVTSTTFDPTVPDIARAAVNGLAVINLSVHKIANTTTPYNTGNVMFGIIATNHGPNFATGVKVTDLLPAGLEFVSAKPSKGTYNPVNGVWNIGTLANGGSETLILIAQVLTINPITNIAAIHGNEHNINPNNTSSVTLFPEPGADLAITKTVNHSTVHVGNNVLFTLRVKNNGPNTAFNSFVYDVIPSGLSYISSTATVGSYSPTTNIWTIGTLPKNNVERLTILAKALRTGTFVNTAAVGSTTFDPKTFNNVASATVRVVTPAKPVEPEEPEEVNAATIPMEKTGAPVGYLLVACLLVLSGLILPKIKR